MSSFPFDPRVNATINETLRQPPITFSLPHFSHLTSTPCSPGSSIQHQLYIARFQIGPLPTVKKYVSVAEVFILRLLSACDLVIVVIPHVRAGIFRVRRVVTS